MHLNSSEIHLVNVRIESNIAELASAISVGESSIVLDNSSLSQNGLAGHNDVMGAIHCYSSDMVFNNSTMAYHTFRAEGNRRGIVLIRNFRGAVPSVTFNSSIFWRESIFNVDQCQTAVSINYSDIDSALTLSFIRDRDLEWGDGNIDADPLFADPDEGDYRLTEDSPCIDAGDPNLPEDPDSTRADMGAYYYHQLPPDDDGILHVPEEYETIAVAIETAADGDSVIISEGEYFENIDFRGRAIVIIGATGNPRDVIIDGDASGSVVTFDSEETESSQLIGITLTNGSNEKGGGINCENSSPTILNCIIENNFGGAGGGISCELNANPTIIECFLYDNEADSNGGGISCREESNPEITRSHISRNHARDSGGGIYMYADCAPDISMSLIYQNSAIRRGGGIMISQQCTLAVSQCQIVENTCRYDGGGIVIQGQAVLSMNACLILDNSSERTSDGIFVRLGSVLNMIHCTVAWEPQEDIYTPLYCSASDVVLLNSIIYGYSPLEISFSPDGEPSSLNIAYTNLGGQDSVVLDPNNNGRIEFLAGTISTDPRYLSPNEGDYDLSEESPCIDSGTSLFVWQEDTLINQTEDDYQGNAPDMGAFESEFVNSVRQFESVIPNEFTITSIYPNPFNAQLNITYEVRSEADVLLELFDLNGRLVTTLVDSRLTAGSHTTHWDGSALTSGIYLVRLKSENKIITKKIVLAR